MLAEPTCKNVPQWMHLRCVFVLQGGVVFEGRSPVCDVTNSGGGPVEETVSRRESIGDTGVQRSQVINYCNLRIL